MWPLWTSKDHIFFFIQIYFGTVFPCQCMCVWVNDTCWKFSIYYKFTKKELLKLTKGITWRHSNIGLKLEKIKFTNTLKNDVHIYIYIYINTNICGYLYTYMCVYKVYIIYT